MSQIEIDMSDFTKFASRMKSAAKGDFKKELTLFMQGLGAEFLRLVQDEIIRREVMDSRLLLASFHQGSEDGVWEISDDGLILEVGTNVRYAGWVNDGHWANPQGVERRWIPGRWEGTRFIYDPGADTGMSLRQQWVEGAHFWESAIRIFEKMFPKLLDAKLQKWLDSYFGM